MNSSDAAPRFLPSLAQASSFFAPAQGIGALRSSWLAATVIASACSHQSERLEAPATPPIAEATKSEAAAAQIAEPAEMLALPVPAPVVADARGIDVQARSRAVAEAKKGLASKAAQTPSFIAAAGAAQAALPHATEADTERYAPLKSHGITRSIEQPVSTFALDVDTGSYTNVRRMLRSGQLPPSDAVRVEEFLNSFRYQAEFSPSAFAKSPLAMKTELARTPWNPKTQLLRVTLAAAEAQGPLPPSNLVFLVDVSGSMSSAEKLPLVQQSLRRLTQQMRARDRISLVTYAGATKVVLASTPGDQQAQILEAIDALNASGGTHGESGLRLAYQQAKNGFIAGGNNRVLLATDGDFNLGLTRTESLIDLIREQRQSGVALSTLGFGSGNYNDHLMEQAANAGDGNYSYIDSLQEAEKVLVAQRASTLLTVARDAKLQVEFNPAIVSEYRLIGYENRALRREDFLNDAVDAGEIGAGHKVTALYEIAVVGEQGEAIAPLRYAAVLPAVAKPNEVGFVKLRFQRPGSPRSEEQALAIRLPTRATAFAEASPGFQLAAVAAGFGQKLRQSPYLAGLPYAALWQWAGVLNAAAAPGEVQELQELITHAQRLSGEPAA